MRPQAGKLSGLIQWRVDNLRKAIAKAKQPIVGLADNGGQPFRCGTCQYFDGGYCANLRKELHHKKVEPKWCCDFYDRPGMKVIIP